MTQFCPTEKHWVLCQPVIRCYYCGRCCSTKWMEVIGWSGWYFVWMLCCKGWLTVWGTRGKQEEEELWWIIITPPQSVFPSITILSLYVSSPPPLIAPPRVLSSLFHSHPLPPSFCSLVRTNLTAMSLLENEWAAAVPCGRLTDGSRRPDLAFYLIVTLDQQGGTGGQLRRKFDQ